MSVMQGTYTLAPEDDINVAEAIFFVHCPEGFVVEDPTLLTAHIEADLWDAHAYDEESLKQAPRRLTAYKSEREAEAMARLEDALRDADLHGTMVLTFEEEKEWHEAWQASVGVLRVGERCQLVPDWCEPEEPIDVVIRLQPGIGFGSGEHETTAMCLKALEKFVTSDKEVIDVGCGSGILAICAKQLGAKRVQAFDNDAQAVEAAKRNVVHNHVDVSVSQSDLLKAMSGKTDLVVANIITDVVMRLVPSLKAYLRPGGEVILSGIHLKRVEEVVELLETNGWTLLFIERGIEWATIVATWEEAS